MRDISVMVKPRLLEKFRPTSSWILLWQNDDPGLPLIALTPLCQGALLIVAQAHGKSTRRA
jgi:hypothetical protein